MSAKLKIVLIVSFGLNVVLAAAYWINKPVAPAASSPTNDPPAFVVQTNKGRLQRTAQAVTVTNEIPLDWRTVESEDYRDYIANLRSIGCPEETVRDIIIADINKLYASKIAALYPAPREMKFWRVEDRAARREEREREESRRQLEHEKRELIKELLGVDYDVEIAQWSGRPSEDAFRYGFLPPEKQEQAKALHDKYREMERALFSDGGLTPENRAKFMALRAEREAEMAKLLGPEDFEQYQLRNSYTARNMRENLVGFQPSEEEFRQIFQLQKTFDDQFGFTRGGTDEAVREQRKAAQQQLETQLRAALGDERFHDYQLTQDPLYRDAYAAVQRYDLPKQAAETVYQVRIAAEQERDRIRNDPNLDPNSRQAALAALANDTQQALRPVLGQNWESFQSRNGWVDRLGQANSSSSRDRDRSRTTDRFRRGR